MITEGNVSDITCPDGHCKKQGRLEAPEVSHLRVYFTEVALSPLSCGFLYDHFGFLSMTVITLQTSVPSLLLFINDCDNFAN